MLSSSSSRSASLDKIVIGDNRRLSARQAVARLSKSCLAVLLVLLLGAVGTGIFLVYVNLQNTTLSYEISHLFTEQKELQDLNRKLRIELASVKSLARLETLAIEQYNMGPPEPKQVVQVR